MAASYRSRTHSVQEMANRLFTLLSILRFGTGIGQVIAIAPIDLQVKLLAYYMGGSCCSLVYYNVRTSICQFGKVRQIKRTGGYIDRSQCGFLPLHKNFLSQ